MGGRSGSSGIGGGGNISKYVKETQGVGRIDLTDNPLQYGPKDYSTNSKVRSAAEKFAEKYKKARVEHVAAIDKNGKMIEERVGDEHSASLSNKTMRNAVEITHNHPGATGYLSGSFSEADISSFSSYSNVRTMKAEGKEGTYSITKKAGFNADGLKNYMGRERSRHQTQRDTRLTQLKNMRDSGKMSEAKYRAEKIKATNKYLVDMHNSYINGQKQYGYAYTLSRRK